MISTWTPDEWQEYAHQLLSWHYGPANWFPIPDKHTGDAGLEGFSSTGHAYQCYAPQGSFDASELHDKYCNKMYLDTKKFIDNASKLSAILGSTVISRWILFVPDHVSAETLRYCNKRKVIILDAGLTYVDATDFFVKVSTDGDYPIARTALAAAGRGRIQLGIGSSSDSEVQQWITATENAEQIKTLGRKLDKISRVRENNTMRSRLERTLLRNYLHGEKLLQGLRDDHPDLYERVRVLRATRERVIELESQLGGQEDSRILDEVQRMMTQFAETLPALQPNHHSELSAHAVADWLLRCPLDFPDNAS